MLLKNRVYKFTIEKKLKIKRKFVQKYAYAYMYN